MTNSPPAAQLEVAIACGGTGGHLFPGLAVADQLVSRGASVVLIVSPKEIDQVAVKTAGQLVVTLPAVGLVRGHLLRFLSGFWRSYRAASRWFRQRPPHAVLAMGGFTSAPPVLAARSHKAAAFLHESNTIPGRANWWLSRSVDCAFVGFPSTAPLLPARQVVVTGTPVRSKFQPRDPGPCRMALGLEPSRPVVLVMGGSQGAHGINELVLRSLPFLAGRPSQWQWLHLAGPADATELTTAYAAAGVTAKVHSFLAEMELALGAATVAVSRAGASSLAELAAMRVPAVLVPFPAATDNHQFHNARAFQATGAAKLLSQQTARPHELIESLTDLIFDDALRKRTMAALDDWHKPQAAEQIAQAIIKSITASARPVAAERGRLACSAAMVL